MNFFETTPTPSVKAVLMRCSSLPKLMGASRNKSSILSQTAISYIEDMANQDFFGYTDEVDTKYTIKGTQCEHESIALYNFVHGTNYVKNTVRKNTDILTGEPDILTSKLIIDIKSSWSIKTFPKLPEQINLADYEWQLRGYMMLFDVDKAQLAYCLTDTPEHLIGYEPEQIHKVSHIDPRKRITTYEFERDTEKEKDIEVKCLAAIEYYTEYINKLNNK